MAAIDNLNAAVASLQETVNGISIPNDVAIQAAANSINASIDILKNKITT